MHTFLVNLGVYFLVLIYFSCWTGWRFKLREKELCVWVCYPAAWGKTFAFLLKIVFLNYGRSNPTRKLFADCWKKTGHWNSEKLWNCLSESLNYAFTHSLFDFKDFRLSIGVKVPITSSVYGYTKVLAHNLNSKKTSGAAFGWKWMLSFCYYFFFLI